MKHEKSIRVRINPWDRQKMVNYLDKQARNGWLFRGFGDKGWNFILVEPNIYHFSVVYFPADFDKDETAVSRLLEFREFCAHAGWELAGANQELQVFYSTREHPVPIDTDPLLEIETMQTMALRKLKPQFKENIKQGLIYLTLGLLAFFENPVWAFTYILLITGLTIYFGKLLVGLIRLGEQYVWRWQARHYAEQYGEYPYSLKHLPFSKIVDILVDIFLLETVIRYLGIGRAIGLGVICVLTVGGAIWVTEWIDNQILRSKTKKILTVVGVIAVIAVGLFLYYGTLNMLNVEISRYAPMGSTWEQYEEAPPISSEDFYGKGTCTTHYFGQVKETIFLAEYNARNYAKDGQKSRDLYYTVLEVKWDFLYGICLKEYQESEMFPVDGAPWGAEAVYRYGTLEEPRTVWLLCYEDRIVEFYAEEEPAPEQMALVGQRLG